MSPSSFVFEIDGLHKCSDYEAKLKSVGGADFVKIDPRIGHVIVTTSKDKETMRIALEDKTRREVVFLYEVVTQNPPKSAIRKAYTSPKSLVFEIDGLHKCIEYETKIKSVIGDDLVKIDTRMGHVVVTTSKDKENVRLALEDKIGREVVLLYQVIDQNSRSVSQNPSKRASMLVKGKMLQNEQCKKSLCESDMEDEELEEQDGGDSGSDLSSDENFTFATNSLQGDEAIYETFTSPKSYLFEIDGLHKCIDYETKIKSVVGTDDVKIDTRIGHVIVKTSKDKEQVRRALEDKTGREVDLLYQVIDQYTHPASQNPPKRASIRPSTADRVSIEVKRSKVVITVKDQTEIVVANALQGKVAEKTSSSRKRLKSHEHDMTLTKGERSSYECSGCKEIGAGDKYVCEDCSYVLHPDCMYYEEEASHEFFVGSTFEFYQTPFGIARRCDACGSDIKRSSYHCEKTDKDLHPCCLYLKETVIFDDMNFRLQKELTSKCFYCSSKTKDDYWCYSLESQGLQAHVSCIKDALLGNLNGKRNKNMSTAIVKRNKQTPQVLKWAKMLLKVACFMLSGNPLTLFAAVIELF